MTKKEAWEKVYTHFIINKSPLSYNLIEDSFDTTTVPQYFNNKGNKCAFGVLLPHFMLHNPFLYDIEGKSSSNLIEDYTEELKEFKRIENLIRDMQSLHDKFTLTKRAVENYKVEDFKLGMLDIKKRYKIKSKLDAINFITECGYE